MALLDFLFGRTKPVPTTTTVQQSSKLPEQIAPFVEEVLGEAQQLYGQRREEGFKEFPGETIAPRTAEELAAIEGLRGLVGVQEPYRAEAEQALRATPTQFTADEAQRLMSPYQRAVTDIEKREAQRVFERDTQPALEAQAIGAGGMSGLGTRAALQAAEAQRMQSQLLADIETKGQQRAFEQAYRQFGDETAAQRQRSQDIGQLGTQRLNIGLAEQGLAQQLGQVDRAEAQALLNEQFAEFVEREQFPESTLAQYSSFVYGNPFLRQPDTARTTSGLLQPSTSMGQQLVGLGLTGLNIYGRGGGFGGGSQDSKNFTLGNLFNQRKGGGLVSLPVVRRNTGTMVGTPLPVIFESSLNDKIQGARQKYRTAGQPLMAGAELRAKIQNLIERTERDKKRQEARRSFYDDRKKGLQSLAPTASDPMSPISAGIEAVYEKPTDPEKVAPPGFIEALSKGTGAIFQAQDKQRAADKKAKADFAKLKFDVEEKEMIAQQGEDIKQEELQSIVTLAKETLPAKEAKEIDDLVASDIGLLDKLAGIKKKTADSKKAKTPVKDQAFETIYKIGQQESLADLGFVLTEDNQLAFPGGDIDKAFKEGGEPGESRKAGAEIFRDIFNKEIKKLSDAGKPITKTNATLAKDKAVSAAKEAIKKVKDAFKVQKNMKKGVELDKLPPAAQQRIEQLKTLSTNNTQSGRQRYETAIKQTAKELYLKPEILKKRLKKHYGFN
tara:strand:- start:2439 stop:4613 length:2175 start_codon:yes stop_codon:yes gene_type:complete